MLGGKGANLAEMTNIGVPVPPGFTIACECCTGYLAARKPPAALAAEVAEHLKRLETVTGRALGDAKRPLLVSVRSGAPQSMPGMMETILNLGLNDATVEALAAESGNARFAYDSYRRFMQMYGDVVLEVPSTDFEQMLRAKRDGRRRDPRLRTRRRRAADARRASTRRSCARAPARTSHRTRPRSSGARSKPCGERGRSRRPWTTAA